MSTCFHGTSADNLKSILKEGLRPDKSKIWTLSQNAVYFYSVKECVKYKVVSKINAKYATFNLAADQAIFSFTKAKSGRVIVIEVKLDDDEYEEDYSCGTLTFGAVAVYHPITPDRFKSVRISNDISLFKPYYIAQNISRPYSNIKYDNLAKIAASTINYETEVYSDDILNKWRKIKL